MLEKVNKPWGHEEIWAQTENYVGKKMLIKSGHRMSLQYHETKEETVLVLEGTLRIWHSRHDNMYLDLQPGQSFHVNPKQVHRFGSPKESSCDTVILEVSTNFLDDVVRLADDYKRTSDI